MAPRHDFDLTIGDSYPPGDGAKFTVTYSVRATGQSVPEPYNLTNAVIAGELVEKKGDLVTLVDFEILKLNQTVFPGQFTFRIPASETGALRPVRHYWRLRMVWPGTDSRTTLVEGYVTVQHAR